jgi:hypothetical protein
MPVIDAAGDLAVSLNGMDKGDTSSPSELRSARNGVAEVLAPLMGNSGPMLSWHWDRNKHEVRVLPDRLHSETGQLFVGIVGMLRRRGSTQAIFSTGKD